MLRRGGIVPFVGRGSCCGRRELVIWACANGHVRLWHLSGFAGLALAGRCVGKQLMILNLHHNVKKTGLSRWMGMVTRVIVVTLDTWVPSLSHPP